MDEPKIEKKMRHKIKNDFETRVELGKPRFHSVDVQDFWCKVVHRVATEDAIRLFCDCIGNTNPLYRSRDYTKNSVYGDIIAPLLCATY